MSHSDGIEFIIDVDSIFSESLLDFDIVSLAEVLIK
jgi:hypothetical protein